MRGACQTSDRIVTVTLFRGANYVINAEAAARVVSAILANGGDAFAIQGDMSVEAQILDVFRQIDDRFGALDALVNNAAIVDLKTRVESMIAALARDFT